MKFEFKNPEQLTVNKNSYAMEFNVFAGHDGYIDHYINGQLRASVALEGWNDYCDCVPAARAACLMETVPEIATETAT